MTRRVPFLSRRLFHFSWCVLAAACVLAGAQHAVPSAALPVGLPSESATVVELRLDGAVMPLPAEYIVNGIDEANRTGAALVLITMNTPGGLDTAMRDIIQKIMASRVPVVAFVSPSGARAASAGFFILLSADVAAMAPGTNTGAASPIFIIGGAPVNIDETLRRKATNDAAAYIRSIADKRGRNVPLAETAVTDAKAFTEKEALLGKLIDLEATNVDDLLTKLDGRAVRRLDGSTTTLSLKNVVRAPLEMTTRQRWLARIAQPDVLFILVIVGLLGLYIEFNHPGLIVPGTVGAVALILAAVAMQILPINVVGILLLLAAIGLFVLEAKYTSHGLLAVGGVIAMLLGALFLIRSPLTGAGVSLGVALGVTIPFALCAVLLMRLVIKSYGWKPSAGVEEMVGKQGEVTEALNGAAAPPHRGMVFVHGELWRAVSQHPVPAGARVRITRVDGLTVHVEPIGKFSDPSARISS